uniref:Uncharacterized protein n=1 Tax=Glossina palpalis gambiensis TaxID=67801 RepID=A0A1B0BKT9_9MUSC
MDTPSFTDVLLFCILLLALVLSSSPAHVAFALADNYLRYRLHLHSRRHFHYRPDNFDRGRCNHLSFAANYEIMRNKCERLIAYYYA